MLLVVAALLALALLSRGWGEPSWHMSGHAEVVDGDTIRLGGTRVRLLGIDAPELAQSCTDAAGRLWACGTAARLRMQQMLGTSVVCEAAGRDVYDRPLAHCRSGDGDLGQAMVVAGLAIAQGEYGADEAAAQAARRGIWAGPFVLPADWRRAHGEGRQQQPWLGRLRWLR